MRMLVLETMERFGSVALFENEQLCESASLAPPQRSAQSLLPAVRAALEHLSWRASDVNVVAVVAGPGSFTGLRVGVTAAKCFAYATGAKVVAVPSLIAIATHVYRSTQALRDTVSEIVVAIDAQRGEAVVQRFGFPNAESDNLPVALAPAQRTNEATLREELTASRSRVITGSALARWRAGLSTCGVCLDEPFWSPTAVSAGLVAISLWRCGETVSWSELSPVYSRPAAAEELAANLHQSS